MNLSNLVTKALMLFVLSGCGKKEVETRKYPYEMLRPLERILIASRSVRPDNPLNNYFMDMHIRNDVFFLKKLQKELVKGDYNISSSEVPKIAALMQVDGYRKLSNSSQNVVTSATNIVDSIVKYPELDSIIVKFGTDGFLRHPATRKAVLEKYRDNYEKATVFMIGDYIGEYLENKANLRKEFPHEKKEYHENAIAGHMFDKHGELGFAAWKILHEKKAYKFNSDKVFGMSRNWKIDPSLLYHDGFDWAVRSYFDFVDAYRTNLALLGSDLNKIVN